MAQNKDFWLIPPSLRNLVNCVNNIALNNPECGPHSQHSPAKLRNHENRQMSECSRCGICRP